MTKTNQAIDIDLFAKNITQLKSLLELFLATLQKEAVALKSQKVESLLPIIEAKTQQSAELSTLSKQIEELIQPTYSSLKSLAESPVFLRFSKVLQSMIQDSIQLSETCLDLNTANGISIQILGNINQHTLNIISGKKAPDIKLYGASGTTQTTGHQTTLGKA